MDLNRAEEDLKTAEKDAEDALNGLNGWAYSSTNRDVELHFNMVKTGNITLKYTKGVTTLPVAPIVAAEIVQCFDTMKMWDKQFDEGRKLQEFEDGKFFTYGKYKAPWPVSQRDFVNVVKTVYDDNGRIRIIATSHPHKDAPEKYPCIRATLMYGAWVFEPTEDAVNDGEDSFPVEGKCKATYITAMNPMGTLPTWLVNQVANDTPMCLAAIADMIQKHPNIVKDMEKRARARLARIYPKKSGRRSRQRREKDGRRREEAS